MFDALIELFKTDVPRAAGISICLTIISALILWVSIIDIRRKKIVFWKMLVASSSTIIGCLIMSFFCGCKLLCLAMATAIPLWFLLLYLNIRFNKDKFIGKADIDLLSALVSICICYSVWLFMTSEPSVAAIKMTHLWYSLFLYLLIGSLIYIAIFLVYFLISVVIFKKHSIRELFKSVKISVIPMILPASIMIPYTIMLS